MTWDFDFYGTVAFWAAVVVVAVAVRFVGRTARIKGWVLLLSSAALLLAIPRFGVADLLGVFGIAGASFAVVRWLCLPGGSPARRGWLAGLGIVGVVAALACFKYRFIQDVLFPPPDAPRRPSDYLFLLGISYFSFKAIHLIVETHKRSVKAVNALDYLNYITFFPSFISGPISRFPHFAEQLGPADRSGWRKDLAVGGERIVHGLFKKLVLASLVFPYSLPALTGGAAAGLTATELALRLYASAFYFYFDFAGYSDLAIGTARLLGMELPENFDRPFLQRNIRELWSHWHMSLTSWLVDYIYWPLVRRLRNIEWFRPRPVLLSALAMTLTFVVCGMWHGDAWNFVLWGTCHGIGISIVTVYQRRKRAIPSPALQRYFRSPASAVVGAIGTFHFFVAILALFLLDTETLGALAASLFR